MKKRAVSYFTKIILFSFSSDFFPSIQETVVLAGQGGMDEVVSRLEAERIQLHRDLQRCMYEIQQRDQYFQQLNTKV